MLKLEDFRKAKVQCSTALVGGIHDCEGEETEKDGLTENPHSGMGGSLPTYRSDKFGDWKDTGCCG